MRTPFNADTGEAAGPDAELMPHVGQVNVGCGAHAGGPVETLAALRLAAAHGVEVAAHPGYPDRANFGRVETGLSPRAIGAHVLSQVGGLLALARAVPVAVAWLKPHGALYHRAGLDAEAARTVAAVAALTGLGLVGRPGSALQAAAGRVGVRYRPEGFADRRYRADGSLVPRTDPAALLTDPAEAAAQVRRLLASGV